MPDTVDINDLNRRTLPPFLAPGAAFYVTGEDKLRLSITNALAGAVVSLRGRFAQLTGIVTPFYLDIVPASDGSTGTTDLPLGEGWILNVDVIVTTGAPTATQTFCTLSIIRGDGSAAIELAVLTQGYATAVNRVFWPWSQQVSSSSTTVNPIAVTKAVAAPAAGANFSQAVPAGKAWRVWGISAQLVTDANAANRHARFAAQTAGGVNLFITHFQVDQTAAQTRGYLASNTAYQETGFDSLDGYIRYPFPNLWLPAGSLIVAKTENIQVGDQWTNVLINVDETTL